MHTIMLQSKPRKTGDKISISIEVLGESPLKDDMRQAISELEHHPARVARRSLIDMLSLIDRFNFKIRYTEHYYTEEDLEAWLFILQG